MPNQPKVKATQPKASTNDLKWLCCDLIVPRVLSSAVALNSHVAPKQTRVEPASSNDWWTANIQKTTIFLDAILLEETSTSSVFSPVNWYMHFWYDHKWLKEQKLMVRQTHLKMNQS